MHKKILFLIILEIKLMLFLFLDGRLFYTQALF